MIKRNLAVVSSALMSFIIVFGVLYNSSSANSTNPLLYKDFEFKEISYGVPCDDAVLSGDDYTFIYNDGLFFLDANELNGDIAKMSVALASAAYRRDEINKILKGPDSDNMGFTLVNEDHQEYIYNFCDDTTGKGLTIYNNDYVAYTIARKEITYNNEDYVVYCVPVRGTAANAEWYSDFHIGEDDEFNASENRNMHLGFQRAAKRVYDDLSKVISTDKNKENQDYDDNHTIILVTGHSRGAAVSNILAGWLNKNTSIPSRQIFGYTFACPAVSTDADTTLTNIYNYNNPGDLITLLPLEKWGYKRNGIDIKSYTQIQKSNIYYQFERLYGFECLSEDEPTRYLSILEPLFKDKETFLCADYQLMFRFVAYALGGKNQSDWKEVLSYDNYSGLAKSGIGVVRFLADVAAGTVISSVADLYYGYMSDVEESYQELIEFIEWNTATVSVMSANDFNEFLEQNDWEIKLIEDSLDKTIKTKSAFLSSKAELEALSSQLNSNINSKKDLVDLFYDGGFVIGARIAHGHMPLFYVCYVNTLYFGSAGWRADWVDEVSISSTLSCKDCPIYTIGSNCFDTCEYLRKFVFSKQLLYIGDNAFTESGIKSLSLPDSICYIGEGAFSDCKKLTGTVSLPANLPEISDGTFLNCSKLTGVIIPDNVKKVCKSAFKNCSSLSDIVVPCDIQYEYDYADVRPFYNCKAVSHVTITGNGPMRDFTYYVNDSVDAFVATPWHLSEADSLVIDVSEGVTSVGEYAFCSCGVTEVHLPSTVTTIKKAAFASYEVLHNKFKTINGLGNVTYIGDDAFYFCTGLSDFDLGDSIVYIGDNSFNSTGISSLNIPQSVSYIGEYAFNECENLEGTIIIPDGITDIKDYTFAGCSKLEKVVIPNSVKTLCMDAFGGCTSLTDITIPCDVEYLESEFVYFGPFEDCVSVNHVTITGNGPMKDFDGFDGYKFSAWHHSESKSLRIDIAEGITRIGENSFRHSNITEIHIPSTVKSIGLLAFVECSKLNDVYYASTKSAWKKISIESYNDDLLNAKFHYSATAAKIVTQPVDYTGKIGESARFSVEAENGLTYQWQYQTSSGAWKNSNSSGNNTPSMSIKITETRDGQKYKCLIKGSDNSVIETAVVAIHVAPDFSIKKNPVDYTGPIGSYASFSVQAEGTDLTFQWQYLNATGNWKNSNSTGYNTPTMSIKITEARDGQKYRCIVSKGTKSIISETAAIHVARTELKILSHPADFSGLVGTYAAFKVVAEGAGITYQWQYNNGSGWKNSNSSGYNTDSMRIKITEARNGQQYRCIIMDKYNNEVISDSAAINVTQPKAVSIESHPADVTGEAGETAKFTVTATGDGLTYQWKYNNGSGWKDSSSSGYNTATLSIKITEARDGQQYKCIVTDKYGNTAESDAAAIHLRKAGPEITSQPVDYTGAIGTTATFTVAVKGDDLTYQWQYNNGSGWKNSSSTGFDTPSMSIKVTQARDGQQYRCVVTNASGEAVSDVAVIHVG